MKLEKKLRKIEILINGECREFNNLRTTPKKTNKVMKILLDIHETTINAIRYQLKD